MEFQGVYVRRKLGDRRIRPRFDIVGDLFGTLETVLRLPVRNIGRQGALIHSHVPLPIESVHRLTFQSEGQDVTADVRVRHVESEMTVDGEQAFLIGVEFVMVPPVLGEQIERWLVTSEGQAAPAEA
jgi:hypothetical protein